MDRKSGMRVAAGEEFGGFGGESGAVGGEEHWTGNGSNEGMRQLKWNQQGTRLAKQLRALYDDREGVGHVLGLQPDVALFSSDGVCVTAHRMVLSLCSPYFEELFGKISQVESLKWKDGPAVVVLGNVKGIRLQQLLRFIYTGEVTVAADQMEEFLEIGNFFQIEGIMESSSSAGDIDCSQGGSRAVLKTTDEQTLKSENDDSDLSEKCSKPVLSGNTTEPPSTSATIIYQDVPHHEMDISCDSYPIKAEGEVDEFLDEDIDAKDDPLQCGMDEVLNFSENDDGDSEKDDPTYGETPSKPKRCRRTSSQNRVDRVDINTQDQVQTGRANWEVQEPVSDESLELGWRAQVTRQFHSSISITYYCAAGVYQCPARIKKKILKDGTVVWLNNGIPHSPHPPVQRKRRSAKPKPVPAPELSYEQSQFVVQCLQSGVTTLNDIILKFKVQGLVPPEEQSLKAFLKRHVESRPRSRNPLKT